jgi:phosphoglycolate phosphatase-like HAD superfamily hydrolase
MSPRRAWDAYDAYLFDIDGTLIRSTDGLHFGAFEDALTTLAGRPLTLEGVAVQGNVDIGILRDALALANIPESQWRPGLDAARARMCRFVSDRKDDLAIRVLPSVPQVLDHLRARGAILGVATGNLEGIGRVKLAHAGLLDRFLFGGYSDAHENRREVFAAALAQARALTGPRARVCVVGDTPEDIRAARANRLQVIAVATGIFSVEELEQEQPTFCVATLAELPLGAHRAQDAIT